jgi:uncharacterized protein
MTSVIAAPLAAIPGDASAPIFKIFPSALGDHVLIVPHSRIFDLTSDLIVGRDGTALPTSLLAALAEAANGEAPLDNTVEPSPQSLSLNVSSSCNLACSYCYAARGSFQGAQPDPMQWEVARAAIDKLLCGADPTAPVTVGFLGGEPFVNRRLIHRAVEYAAMEGRRRGMDMRFSVTTNGTLLNADDVELLRTHRFAVTVSVDGGEQIQNLQRPTFAGQKHSYDLLLGATRPLLANPGLAIIAARATVNRCDLNLSARFEAILSMGFREVGFAPLRAAQPAGDALRDEDWPKYLAALVEVAKSELQRACNGASIRLSNFAVALKQLYRGASSPYPCGAGGGYFSVAANGDWYACHRAIGSSKFRMGDNGGLDVDRRREFLAARHVHAQPACRTCWARYLCSGGCHQEASSRTESSCGFIRGWLEFCLGAYCELAEQRPEFFGEGAETQSKETYS